MSKTIEAILSLKGKPFPSVTPFGKWLSGIVVDGGEDTLTLEFDVRDDMANPIGIMHGGIISAILDEMAGFTVYSMLSTGVCKKFVMISSSVDFLAPARIGQKVKATTTITRNGKIAVNVDCHLVSDEGVLIAKGSINIIKLSNI